MASTPTLPLVSVDEYLNTTYEHDMEYLDGVLVERGIAHGCTQPFAKAAAVVVYPGIHQHQGVDANLAVIIEPVPAAAGRIVRRVHL